MKTDIYYAPYHNDSSIEKVPSFFNNNDNEIDINKLSIIEKYKNAVGIKLTGTIENLLKAWGLLLENEVINKLGELDTYKHDLIDSGVNILTNGFDIERRNFTSLYTAKKFDRIKRKWRKIINSYF